MPKRSPKLVDHLLVEGEKQYALGHRAGQIAMRERAAKVCGHSHATSQEYDDACADCASNIRALPVEGE